MKIKLFALWNQWNNRIANLSYGPASDNAADRSRHGTAGAWMKAEAPLTDAQVDDIRGRRLRGEKLKDIEAATGVDRRKVSQIATGKTYKVAALEWPLPNLWLGVSVESQKYADERILLLSQTPAAVRFLSVEPQLEAVNVHLPHKDCNHPSMDGVDGRHDDNKIWECNLCDGYVQHENDPNQPGFQREKPGIDWVICGGESGPGARPFNLAWAESLLAQCRAAGVPFFMKQVGSNPTCDPGAGHYVAIVHKNLRNSKGGDPTEWPEHLRVRQFPERARSK